MVAIAPVNLFTLFQFHVEIDRLTWQTERHCAVSYVTTCPQGSTLQLNSERFTVVQHTSHMHNYANDLLLSSLRMYCQVTIHGS